MKRIFVYCLICLGFLLTFGAMVVSLAHAATLSLYSTSLNNTPDQQGFIYFTQPFPPSQATNSFSGGVAVLDTTAVQNDYAGYQGRSSHVPTLDRNSGYQLNFQLRLDSESHAGSDRNGDMVDDRAGFSVILLSNDLEGVEMGFWEDEIWVQDDDSQQAANMFTHAEGADWDTTAVLTDYTLTIRDDAYMIEVDGQCLLTGALRNYTNHVGLLDPYETPNYLFMGDDTSSAQAKAELGNVTVDTTAVQIIPQSPTTLTAIPNHNNINLSWTAVAEKYELWQSSDPYLDPTNSSCNSEPACTVQSSNSQTDMNALNEWLNVYVVRGTNSCGLLGDRWVKTAVFSFKLQSGG